MDTPTKSPAELPGVKVMTPLEMNEIHFSKLHTVLTQDVLKKLDEANSHPEQGAAKQQ